MEPLVDFKKVSELIGAKPSTIRVWCWQKRIPFLKVGRLTRFRVSDIQRWIEEGNSRNKA